MSAKLNEMFADATSATERGDRLEALKDSLTKSIERHDAKKDGFVAAGPGVEKAGIQKGMGPGGARATGRNLEKLAERFSAITKGMDEAQQAEVNAELESLRGFIGDLDKDITVASPGNLHPYDLEAPAKQLVPRFTPLRNELPRQKGQGTAREFRRILGYSNTGMGGVANLTPFFNSEADPAAPNFGQLSLRRGAKISYAMDVKTANYVEMSLSDMVTWKAYFTDLGFENVRQLSQMALLWSHLLGEERAMLYGRGGSGSGYEGDVAAPTATVATASGGSIPAATYSVKLTAYSGQGETAPIVPTNGAALVVSANGTITVTMNSEPTGALSYGLYVGPSGNEHFQGFFIPNDNTGTKFTLSSYNAGGANPGAVGTSSNAAGYDGFLSVLSDPAQAGYFARFNTTYAGTNTPTIYNSATSGFTNLGDQPWQDAFASLYASVYADPEDIWVAAPQRRQLTDYLRAAGGNAAAYRISVADNSMENGVNIGGLVVGIVNESSPTGRIVDLRVHPYMPSGASFIRQRVLPIPDSGIGDTTAVTSVQDYMSVDWPEIQFTYDASTYWYGTLIHYAPKWSACLLGLH